MISMTSSGSCGCELGKAERVAGDHRPGAKKIFVECPVCAFEPPEQLLVSRAPRPKCHASCWKRSVRPAPDAALGQNQHHLLNATGPCGVQRWPPL